MKNVEDIQVGKFAPYAKNARTHSQEQIEKIAASIREFGFVNPGYSEYVVDSVHA